MAHKPYIDYKLIGVRTFTAALDESKIPYVLFEGDGDALFDLRAGLFDRETDTIRVGRCTGDGMEAYFAEFGIRITKSYRSHIVFIYDHHPSIDELADTADAIEPLIGEGLASVNPSDLAPKDALH